MDKRKHPATTEHNYVRMINDALAKLDLPQGTLAQCEVKHDDWCDCFTDGYCNCQPELRFIQRKVE